MSDDDSANPADLVFVGGTGRSGTHILSYLLDRHSRFHGVPIECRFHCNPKGLADVVTGARRGRGLPDQAARLLVAPGAGRRPRLRAGEVAGVRAAAARSAACTRDRSATASSEAVARFEETHAGDLPAAARTLFYDLLRPARRGRRQAGAGRDELLHDRRRRRPRRDLPGGPVRAHASATGATRAPSKVSLRQKAHHPTDVASGIEFWADRLRQAEEGCRRLSDADRERLHVISLDELVQSDRDAAYAALLGFLGVADEPAMREFFDSGDERRRRPPRALARGARRARERLRSSVSTSRRSSGSSASATTARRSFAARTSAPRFSGPLDRGSCSPPRTAPGSAT